MVNRKTASALTIAALLACAVPVKSVSTKTIDLTAILGQAAPKLSVPDTVKENTEVRISSSSDNMNAISQALGAGFEGQYATSKVEVATKDANAAIQDVLKDNADLAAISRPLTEAEKAQGLVSVPVRREKIAIVVSKDNPFAQSITGSQFAQIFRGEIKDWSSVGGAAGPIRVIDRPDASETRSALKPYPVFTTADFKTGDNTTQLGEDSTEALAKEIGKDGIGYVLVGELANQPNLKALELHKTLPSDPRYPFSQPYAFVYNGEASEAAAAFLGYATGNPGQAALEGANLSGGYSILPGGVVAGTTATATAGTASGSATSANGQAANADGTAGNGNEATAKDAANGEKTAANGTTNATGADATGTAGENGTAGTNGQGAAGTNGVTGDSTSDGAGDAASGDVAVDASGNVIDGEAGSGVGNLAAGRGRWWWLLLPLAGLGLLIWAAGKRGSEEETGYIANTSNRDDDTIRNNAFRSGNLPDGKLPDGKVGASVGTGLNTGVNKAVVGGTAIAGGVAAAGAGLAGRMKNKTGDITMDLDGIKGNVAGGIDDVKGSAKGGLGSLRSNIQGGIDGVKGGVAGGIDGVKGGVAGGIDSVRGGIDGIQGNATDSIDGVKGNVQGSIDGLKGQAEGGLSGLRSNVQGGIDNVKSSVNDGLGGVQKTVQGNDPDSWLDRAKQRINEATEQIKDSASDIKDDITKD